MSASSSFTAAARVSSILSLFSSMPAGSWAGALISGYIAVRSVEVRRFASTTSYMSVLRTVWVDVVHSTPVWPFGVWDALLLLPLKTSPCLSPVVSSTVSASAFAQPKFRPSSVSWRRLSIEAN